MENKDNIILKSVPDIILKGCKTKIGRDIEEYKFEHLTNIVIQEYADYNMIVIKCNLENKVVNNTIKVNEFVLNEYPLNEFGEIIEDYDCNKTYRNMKLLLMLRDSVCDGITEFYYIFADAEISNNALKKELNWILDREISKKSVDNRRKVELDFETKSSLKDLNVNLVSIQNMISRSLDNLAKEINNKLK